jgi:hypothetical protein
MPVLHLPDQLTLLLQPHPLIQLRQPLTILACQPMVV